MTAQEAVSTAAEEAAPVHQYDAVTHHTSRLETGAASSAAVDTASCAVTVDRCWGLYLRTLHVLAAAATAAIVVCASESLQASA